MAHELKQTRHVDASWRTVSLDDIFNLNALHLPKAVALVDHKPTRRKEIRLRAGDVLSIPIYYTGNRNSYLNGYVNVTSERANKSGLVPFYKIKITS
jgi:hypothetical protein